MKNTPLILLITLVFACGQPAEQPETPAADTAEAMATEPEESGVNQPTLEDDCVFDRMAQTDAFMAEEFPQYPDHSWDDHMKTATVVLDNGDTLKLTRGGCAHYTYALQLITKNDGTLAMAAPGEALKQALGWAETAFPDSDYQLMDSLVTHRLYDQVPLDDQLYFSLHQQLYCDMSIMIQPASTEGYMSIEVMYYMC